MKFCKDCKHYQPAMAYMYFAVGASCNHGNKRDPVTGDKWIAGMCDSLRAEGGDCGPQAVWFNPANLDGRLAMLEDTKEQS